MRRMTFFTFDEDPKIRLNDTNQASFAYSFYSSSYQGLVWRFIEEIP